jgi:hypothetical protein
MRAKITAVGLATTFVVLAATCATASAVFELSAQKCEGGAHIALCYGTVEKPFSELMELVGEEEFTFAPAESKMRFKSAVGEEEVFFECGLTVARHGSELANGLFLQASPLTANLAIDLVLHFTECTLTKSTALAKKCEIPSCV